LLRWYNPSLHPPCLHSPPRHEEFEDYTAKGIFFNAKAQCRKENWLFGMFRDASPYLAARRRAELIPPYIWQLATPIPNEPKLSSDA